MQQNKNKDFDDSRMRSVSFDNQYARVPKSKNILADNDQKRCEKVVQESITKKELYQRRKSLPNAIKVPHPGRRISTQFSRTDKSRKASKVKTALSSVIPVYDPWDDIFPNDVSISFHL